MERVGLALVSGLAHVLLRGDSVLCFESTLDSVGVLGRSGGFCHLFTGWGVLGHLARKQQVGTKPSSSFHEERLVHVHLERTVYYLRSKRRSDGKLSQLGQNPVRAVLRMALLVDGLSGRGNHDLRPQTVHAFGNRRNIDLRWLRVLHGKCRALDHADQGDGSRKVPNIPVGGI